MQAQVQGGLIGLSGLGVTVVGAPKCDCHRTGPAAPDYSVIDAHDRQHNLACGRNKGFASAVGFLQRERSLLDGKACRPYGIE
jgi:hypothetical protein